MKRACFSFIGFWFVIFLISFATAKYPLSLEQRLLYIGVLALVGPFLTAGDKKKTQQQYHDVDIHLPQDPKPLYRVRAGKIYEGLSRRPIYEIKGFNIYPVSSSTLAFRIERGRVYRALESVPLLEIKGDKIYKNLDSKVMYEIKRGLTHGI